MALFPPLDDEDHTGRVVYTAENVDLTYRTPLNRRRLLFLLVVEPATLFEFAFRSLYSSYLVTVADDNHLPGLEVVPLT